MPSLWCVRLPRCLMFGRINTLTLTLGPEFQFGISFFSDFGFFPGGRRAHLYRVGLGRQATPTTTTPVATGTAGAAGAATVAESNWPKVAGLRSLAASCCYMLPIWTPMGIAWPRCTADCCLLGSGWRLDRCCYNHLQRAIS